MSSSKSHLNGGEFNHLVAYYLACTFENEVMNAKKYGCICFGSLNEVIDEDDLECLNEGKARRLGGFEDHSTSICYNPVGSMNPLTWWSMARSIEQLSVPKTECFYFMRVFL